MPVTPDCYFTVNDPENPLAVHYRDIVRATHLFWESQVPRGDEAMRTSVARLVKDTGARPYTLKNSIIVGLDVLSRLPLLNALQHELFHLDLDRVTAIGRLMEAVDREDFGDVDRHLTAYLTPTVPGQALPTVRQLEAKLTEIIRALDPEIIPGQKEPPRQRRYGVDHNDVTSDFLITLDLDEGVWLDKLVRARAAKDNTTLGEAFVALVKEKSTTRVVLNLYKATDIEAAPAWMPQAGWLSERSQRQWESMVTQVRDMDSARTEYTAAHDATRGLSAWVDGRDGTCRFPGCTHPADTAQQDHRINHHEGGSTSCDGLANLCQHHHNMKTDGVVRYLLDPSTGIAVWMMDDATWQVSVPSGPLSCRGIAWARTIAQYRSQRCERARELARRAAREEVGLDTRPWW
ncbi:HNH endonuclease signature motif containing protein [uncultured Corynebacterium sp.]|uniref:HNH endonuclease signature motif containing protein n=1 Tax=uncultured Corynebacterium sp. TaxID=159447 RepID=UPI00288A183A|nr:HNH endonuclease signature motif containing protein [uncultured Corynebacterium sp.]